VLRSILDLTPAESIMPRVQLQALDPKLKGLLTGWLSTVPIGLACVQSLEIRIQPRVLYGVEMVDSKPVPVSHWSAVIELKTRDSKTLAQVELTSPNRAPNQQVKTVMQDIESGLVRFSQRLKSALDVLVRPASTLRNVFESGSIAEQKMLLERISLCAEDDFDAQLSRAVSIAVDEGVRFRLVGLIGERSLHGAAHQLIDLIDLNNIEWTRSVIRTLSTLNHPRTLELISILAVHESPALQKELKAAVERLERK
jgi:hypothetical protein